MSYPPSDQDLLVNYGNTTQNADNHPLAHNKTNLAIRAIRDELGANPSGSKATVQERLNDLESQINLAILSGGEGSFSGLPNVGDIVGTYPYLNIGTNVINDTHINASLKDSTVAGVKSLRSLGTNAGQALPGNHSTVTDSRNPKGPAGGDLSGTYPNPTIGAGRITNAAIADGTIQDSKMANPAWLPGELKWTAVTYTNTNPVPTGWLLCDGSAVSRSTYSELFAAIGTTFGTGDGSTTFNLPNARSRTLLAAGSASGGLTARTVGASGGLETVALTTSQMPQHNHPATSTSTVSDPGHTHNLSVSTQARSDRADLYVPVNFVGGTVVGSSSAQTGISVTTATTIANNGSGTAHENMMPYLVGNLLIKT